MPVKDLYEYAVIRIVPRVEREEFVNTGIILYCPKQRFLGVRHKLDSLRIQSLCPEACLSDIWAALDSLQRISMGINAGPIGYLDMPSRFRWLTAWRSTVVQTSRVHSGLCDDAPQMLERLFAQLVV